MPPKDQEKRELRQRARELLDDERYHKPPPGREPHPISDIPQEEHKGNWRGVKGGGEPT